MLKWISSWERVFRGSESDEKLQSIVSLIKRGVGIIISSVENFLNVIKSRGSSLRVKSS